MNMSQMPTKKWCIRLIVLVFICFGYYCSNALFESYVGTNTQLTNSKTPCDNWEIQKWQRLNLNLSRQTELFLKPDDFIRRERLSKLPLPYGIKGCESLLQKILAVTTNKVPENIEKLKCKTCAVIGNGFGIKNQSLGRIINKYDLVFRLNDAPVKGYEEDVGNKTTMRLFYPESAFYNPGLHNEPGTLMVLVPFKPQDLQWLKEILYKEKRESKGFWKPPPQVWLGDLSKVRVLDPYFMQMTAEKLLRIPLYSNGKQIQVHPTTGILAVFVALNYCDVVDIAGFGYPNSNSESHPVHYYGQQTMQSMKNSYHDLHHEAATLKRLEDLGAIFYLHPHS